MLDTSTIAVLIIEDDVRLASLTRDYLEHHGAVVHIARDGQRGLEEALNGSYDAILLDIMLPKLDGLEVLKRLREMSDVPIIMITARGEEADKVMGLEIGADDYVSKPYSARELLARIRSTVRRSRGNAGPKTGPIHTSGLSLDPGTRQVLYKGEKIDLTGYEFQLLYALAERAGQVLSRERLMTLARGNAEESFDRSIDVHISRIRQKLGEDPKKPRLIKTIRGVGYQLTYEDTE
ncbi:MAG: response regulator transcription factor [Myxococcota bacterium]|nr:response regulator transcription factor [Myxococcota bacterium]